MIYLDNNATTRPAPEVVAAMQQCLEMEWGNPSSPHALGQSAKRLLGAARAAVAQLLGAKPVEVVFTSGATEANQAVLNGIVARGRVAGIVPRVVMSAVEHAAMLKAAQRLAEAGDLHLDFLPVDGDGRVDIDRAGGIITADTALVSLMAANNETGVLQPIAEIRDLAKSAGAHLHVDATQSAGKLPFDFNALGIDLASVSAHKLHGPKGIGALLLRKGLEWPALLPGSQERGRRGGTENLPGIVGFGAAAKLAAARMLADVPTIQALRCALERQLLDTLPVRIFGGGAPRLPNTTYLRIGALDADLVLNRLERADVVAASGSACAAGGHEPSHVLLAMGVDADEARGALRLSLSHETTAADIEAMVACLLQVCQSELAVAA